MSYKVQRVMPVSDTFGRPLQNLRLSVTDRCNLRCAYCMPEEEYAWLPQEHLLTFEEISALVDRFAKLGVTKVRLTGGEPLLRRDLPELVRMLADKPTIADLAITTNGVLLDQHAHALRKAGLHRVTVSLDTLDPKRFQELARRDLHARVIAGISATAAAGFTGTKLDMVVMRGRNDDEILPMLAFAGSVGAELRYIEYMDVGGATRWSMRDVVSRAEILATIAGAHGVVRELGAIGNAPAERFVLVDGTMFGIVASTTKPFCSACDRARLTADGMWYLCLYARSGLDLKRLVRGGASAAEIESAIARVWNHREDRGAERRLASEDRGPLAGASELKNDPHLEMHTRGG